jgi:L-galactose dehydrogenase
LIQPGDVGTWTNPTEHDTIGTADRILYEDRSAARLMDTVTFGRTGLRVGVAGLGCGGYSQLGRGTGATAEESIRLVHRAIDLGVNFLDTAPAYGTEDIVGRALIGHRDRVVVSTKASPRNELGVVTPAELRHSLEVSLRQLGCDSVDVFHLHAVVPADYGYCVDALVPEMQRMRDDGLLRFIGVTEQFSADPSHQLLQRAVLDGCWDTIMVGFNLLNPSAGRVVLPAAKAADIGIEVMFAVRRALRSEGALVQAIRSWISEGRVTAAAVDDVAPLEWLLAEGVVQSLPEAAYRFARHESGCHVVLTGTGDIAHLEDNIRAIHGPRLPDAVRAALATRLRGLHDVTGD